MISSNESIKLFKSKNPNLTVTRCMDYDKNHYVVEAVENIDSSEPNGSFYGIDKRNGKITGFIPALDLDEFFDAIDNRTIYRHPKLENVD